MGCKSSAPATVACRLIDPRFEKVQGKYSSLDIDDFDLATLHAKFVKAKEENSEVISITSALAIFGFQGNNFMRKVFSALDENQSGNLDFTDFLVVIWNFCTIDNHLGAFVYDLYRSTKQEGSETEVDVLYDTEAIQFLRDVNHNHIVSMVQLFRPLCRGLPYMSKLIFREFVKGHPQFVAQAATIRDTIIQNTLNKKAWNRMMLFRMKLCNFAYLSPKEIRQLVAADIIKKEEVLETARLPGSADLKKSEHAGVYTPAAATSEVMPCDGPSDGSIFAKSTVAPPATVTYGNSDGLNTFSSMSVATKESGRRRRTQRHSLDSLPSKSAGRDPTVQLHYEENVAERDEAEPDNDVRTAISRKRRRKNRQTFPVQVDDADMERDKLLSKLMPNAQPAQYGCLGVGYRDVTYARDGFEFDHSKFLANLGHIDAESKLAYDVKHQAPRHLGINRKRELGNIGFVQ